MITELITMDEQNAKIEQGRIERAAEVLKTVAHPLRLRIVELLESGEKSVNELRDLLGVTPAADLAAPLPDAHARRARQPP